MTDNFEFRSIHPDEVEQAIAIEQICFPPNEACSPKAMTERIAKVPQLFLVVIDKSTGKLAGFLNGVATDEEKFRDEFFTDIDLCDENGKNVMLLGLDVLPEYRGQGLARELVYRYSQREKANGRKKLFLTCLEQKVEMYKKFGLQDLGIADSTWGGEEWHVLKNRPNVVSIYIEAPRAFCVERTITNMGVTPEVANATIERTDKFRADYYKYYTHGNYWTNPVNYDLTLNSERVGVENCVKTIEQYLIIKGFIKADMIKPVGELI